MIQTLTRHFWITFDNGYQISVFNGYGSYSENHFNYELIKDKNTSLNGIPSKDCEVAVIYKPSGKFATRTFIEDIEDDVKGYVSVDELVDLINKVKNYKD